MCSEIDDQQLDDIEDNLEVCSARDVLRFDVAIPLTDPEIDEENVDMQKLAGKIKEAILAVMDAETGWEFEGSEVLKSGDELEYEAPFYIERIDFGSPEEEREKSDEE